MTEDALFARLESRALHRAQEVQVAADRVPFNEGLLVRAVARPRRLAGVLVAGQGLPVSAAEARRWSRFVAVTRRRTP